MSKSIDDVIRLLTAEYLLDSSQGKNETLVVTSDENKEDLSSYRTTLISETIQRIYKQAGWNIVEQNEDPTLHWDIRLDNNINTCNLHKNCICKTFVCGVVRNCDTRKREKQISTEEYHSLREGDLREDTRAALVSASVTLDLLHVIPSKCVTLDFKHTSLVSRGSSNKGAAFFLYNYARISTILQKHADLVAKSSYPPLSNIEAVASLLCNSKSEIELLEHVLQAYTSILEDLNKSISKHELPQPSILCRYLGSACGVISKYYRSNHVLTEARDHLVPMMHARLHLLIAVQRVLQRVFCLLDITALNSM